MQLHTEGTTSIDVAIHIETAGGLIRVHDLVAALVVPDLILVPDLVAALVVPDLELVTAFVVHITAPVADFAVTFPISSFYFIF